MGFVPILSLKVALSVMCSEKVQEKYRCECTLYFFYANNFRANSNLHVYLNNYIWGLLQINVGITRLKIYVNLFVWTQR